MREERIEPAGIPARLYDPGGASGLLLLGHGGAHSKDADRFVRLCRTYAEGTGLAVLCIDAVAHGERRAPGPPGGIPARWHSSTAPQMVDDWASAPAALADIGPPLAYVGFSMGAIFGPPTVAALASVRAAVFVAGGIVEGGGIDDPELGDRLVAAAGRIDHAEVLMLNTIGDEVIAPASALRVFAALPGDRHRLVVRAGGHDDWSDDAIAESVAFIRQRTTRLPG